MVSGRADDAHDHSRISLDHCDITAALTAPCNAALQTLVAAGCGLCQCVHGVCAWGMRMGCLHGVRARGMFTGDVHVGCARVMCMVNV